MATLRQTPSTCSAADLRIAVAIARWHSDITDALLSGAREAFEEAGGDAQRLHVVHCPGAWELSATATTLAGGDPPPDAVVALGCVIRGETDHDRWIIHGVTTALAMLTVRTGVPVGFGVLTCADESQARARAGGARGNKGFEAMAAAIEQATLTRALHDIETSA